MTNPVLQTALTLVGAGVSVIPISANKRPAIASWKPYQARLATMAELLEWLSNAKAGIAIIAGSISGNIEILDFDDITTLNPWYTLVESLAPGLISRLVVVMTPTGGRHIYYRCASIQGNTKLAVNSNREVMIETRGEGGYALIPPSPAWCHPDHKAYVLRQGDLANIPTITPDERAILLNGARTFNEFVEPERLWTLREASPSTIGERPGDLFAQAVEWSDVLIPHGWRKIGQRGEVGLWCRPGKKRGLSATTGWQGTDLLYCFSSNAWPFEPERGYSKFTAYALLNCGGDFIKAATRLARQGYVKAHAGQTMASNQYFESFQGFKGYRA
jgi:hypothetical protein